MSTFDEREKGFEAKYRHDQETQFRITARRNKLLGLWAAQQMGLTGEAADAYAKEVVTADFERPGHEDVIEKVVRDLTAKGVETTDHRVRRELERFHAVAREQIANG